MPAEPAPSDHGTAQPPLPGRDAAPSAVIAAPPLSCRIDLPPAGRPLSIEAIFGAPGPLEVDVGCGKGRFLLAMARRHPDVMFLGIEKRRKRIEKVDRKACREGLTNIRLLLTEAACLIEELMPPLSARAVYIFFPDPWPKRRHHRRRLFSAAFIDALHRTLSGEGRLHLATDDEDYYLAIRQLFAADRRFVDVAAYQPADDERTEFETIFLKLGRPIHRCSFAKVAVVDPT